MEFEVLFWLKPCSYPTNGISTEGMQICINYMDNSSEIVTVDSAGRYTKADGSTGYVRTVCADNSLRPKLSDKSGQFDIEIFAEDCSTHFNVDIVAGNFLVMLKSIFLYDLIYIFCFFPL